MNLTKPEDVSPKLWSNFSTYGKLWLIAGSCERKTSKVHDQMVKVGMDQSSTGFQLWKVLEDYMNAILDEAWAFNAAFNELHSTGQ